MFWPFTLFLINIIFITMGRERYALALGFATLVLCIILLLMHLTTPLEVIL